jgi:PEP-CTERM motif
VLNIIDFKIPSRKPIGILSILLMAGGLQAATVTFSEVPASNDNPVYLTTEYAYLGLTFVNNNGSVWGGNSNGDPGNWNLEGTNTAPFLGFNGAGPTDGYSATLVFSAPVSNFSLDVSAGNGGFDTQTFTLNAFDSGSNLLFSDTVNLLDVNSWQTVTASISGISRIDISGAGTDFYPFGIDNLQWTSAVAGVPEPSSLALIATGLLALGFRLRRK